MSSSGRRVRNNDTEHPKIAIIGGSGLCTFDEIKVTKKIYEKNRYGWPSDKILIGSYGGVPVAFLPRHGSKHSFPPHKIPYKANIEALKKIGIQYIFATCIAGSLKKKIKPGSLVVPDQFIDFTSNRDDYKGSGKDFIHLPMGLPYCETLRKKLIQSSVYPIIDTGTVVVIQGPRFSTAAESKWFIRNGWDIVNMTQYPECYFAKAAGICYAALGAITDYDVGLHEKLSINPETMPKILKIFKANITKTKEHLLSVISSFSATECSCAQQISKPYYQK